jgi:hypothetical protein
MTTEQTDFTASPSPEPVSVPSPEQSVTAVTDSPDAPVTATEEQTTQVPEATQEQPPQPVTAPTPSPDGTAPAPPQQYSPEHIQRMQQESAQYAQIQAQAALQNQATQYKQQLESQGFLPEHAQQSANEYMQSQQRQMDLVKQAEEYGRHVQGKQIAAEHFVQKYNLNIRDLTELRKYNDPESMDKGAQKLSNDRRRDEELAKYKQGQVPAQAVDNSQGNPQVAADEGGWLDRYNAGDRTPSAVAAAARAAGIS